MASIQRLSRRSIIKGSAATLVGCLLTPSAIQAKQGATPGAVRDPLIASMAPSTVGASDSFKQARGHDIVLNTQVQSEAEVQNRFDLAVLEMFNVMKANEDRVATGAMGAFITAGNIPVGTDTSAFSKVLSEVPGEYLITAAYYSEDATTRNQSEWGAFDAKQGLKVQFVEEFGLFDVTVGMVDQIFGYTPRLTESNGLQLDIYAINQPFPPDYPNQVNAADIATTWAMSNMMQVMMLSYGSLQVFDPFYFYENTETQMELLYNLPYTVNDTIASLLSNQPVGSGNYFAYGNTSKTSLLDSQPL